MPTVGTINRTQSDLMALAISREPGRLVDTMEFMEPVKKFQYVPNHILETKSYAKVAKNSMIHAQPSAVHFEGFTPSVKRSQKLKLINASTDVIALHIIPPQTKYFQIKYTKSKRMVPGLTLECTIEFTGDEFRYYYDCIRINCQNEENLLIPLHSYPVLNLKDFPKDYTFPLVPVGECLSKKFPLKCDVPVDFEFELEYVRSHPFFSIFPMSGTIPGHGETLITVTFSPCEFLTAQATIQLKTSQFNSQPIICQFTGSSAPGLLKERSKSQYLANRTEVLDPRCLSPLDRARSNRKALKTKSKTSLVPQETVKNGIKFPALIDTPHAVAQVLNQQPGKLKAKDVRETMLSQKDSKRPSNRQMKEAMFEQAVRKNVYEERQNQLRWQVKLGDDQMSQSQKVQILEERDEAWNYYKFNRREDPIPEDEYNRNKTSTQFRRTFRNHTHLSHPEEAKFDLYSNDMWSVRHAALDRFVQAARKIIIRNRGETKLNSLRKVVIDWSKKKYAKDKITNEQQEKLEEDSEKEEIAIQLNMTPSKIHHLTFPTYKAPDVKDDMAPDALGIIPYLPTDVIVQKKVPYFNLKVPQQYQLNGYTYHNVHTASIGYIPVKLIKPLRVGAEDEIITVSLPEVQSTVVDEDDVDEEKLVVEDDNIVPSTTIHPPRALFNPIEYPPLHIFNPAPGLQVFHQPVQYSEVTPDFHLCPLPRYPSKESSNNPHTATQKKYLDREDIIRGTQTWKKFPSQGLTSLANTPTLTNVWVPRWDDTYSNDLLPFDVPTLLDGFTDEDSTNITSEEENMEDAARLGDVYLTPEMVTAQFPAPDAAASSSQEDMKIPSDMFPIGNKMPSTNIPVGTYGPVPREKREAELEYYITKKYNKLGNKIQSKIHTMNAMINDQDLVLK